MKKKKGAFLFSLSCFLFLLFPLASAREGIRIGQARLRPSLAVEPRFDDFDDNIHLIISPTLQLNFPFGRGDRHFVQVIYSPEVVTFFEPARENYVNQDISGKLRFNFPRGHLFLNNLYRDVLEQIGVLSETRQSENRFEALLGWGISRLSFELGYVHFARDFDKYKILEYSEVISTLAGHYQLLPRSRLLLEYNRGEIDYVRDPSRDGHYDQIWIGLQGEEVAGRITGIVKVGYHNRDYDLAGEPDIGLGVAEIDLLTTFRGGRELGLNYERTVEEAIYGPVNFVQIDRISIRLTQRLGPRFTGRGSLTFKDKGFAEKTTWGGETKKRVDDIWTIGLGLEYHLRDGIGVRIGYECRSRDSNFDRYDYTRNLVSLSFTL
jgi:hypothetical protein